MTQRANRLKCRTRAGLVALGSWLTLAMSLASALAATTPKPAWLVLEESAAEEGAAAVRDRYQRQVEAILERLEQAPEAASLKISLQQRMSFLWLLDYLRSWALAEARDAHLGKTSGGDRQAIMDRLLGFFARAMTFDAPLRAQSQRWRAQSGARELERLGLAVSPEASIAHDRDLMVRYVAILAQLTGGRPQVERVLSVPGIPAELAGELLADDHDYDALLRIPRTPEPLAAPPLTEAEQSAIRHLIEDFWQASIDRDIAALKAIYAEAAAAESLFERLSDSGLVSCDLSAANFNFERLEADLILVRVDNVSAVKIKDGNPSATVGGKTFQVILRHGRPVIARLGGRQ